MKRYILAVIAFVAVAVVAVPVFADAPGDIDLKTNQGVEKFFAQQQENSP